MASTSSSEDPYQTSRRLLRFSMYCRRNPSLSEPDFHRYWTERHGQIARPWLLRHGIVKYTQYHTPSFLIDQTASLNPIPQFTVPENSLRQYDGVVELLVPDVESLRRAFEDPEYIATMAPDEEKFSRRDGVGWSIGWEEVYIKDGQGVDLRFGDSAGGGTGILQKGQESHYLAGHDGGGDEGLGSEHLGERHGEVGEEGKPTVAAARGGGAGERGVGAGAAAAATGGGSDASQASHYVVDEGLGSEHLGERHGEEVKPEVQKAAAAAATTVGSVGGLRAGRGGGGAEGGGGNSTHHVSHYVVDGRDGDEGLGSEHLGERHGTEIDEGEGEAQKYAVSTTAATGGGGGGVPKGALGEHHHVSHYVVDGKDGDEGLGSEHLGERH